jgi:hypothetical protein
VIGLGVKAASSGKDDEEDEEGIDHEDLKADKDHNGIPDVLEKHRRYQLMYPDDEVQPEEFGNEDEGYGTADQFNY